MSPDRVCFSRPHTCSVGLGDYTKGESTVGEHRRHKGGGAFPSVDVHNRLLHTSNGQSAEEFEKPLTPIDDCAGGWAWEVNAQGVYTYSSHQIERHLGYRPEEVIGKTPFERMPPSERERISKIFKTLTSSGSPIVALENIKLHKDGRLIVLETNGVPFFNAKGELAGYRGVDRDITARKLREKELLRMETYFSNIMDAMPSMFLSADSNGTITRWDHRCHEFTGIPPEKAVGKPFTEILPHLRDDWPAILGSMQDRRVRTLSRRTHPKKGTCFFEDVTIYPLIDKGVDGVMIRTDDVTEEVRMEEKLIQSEKMQCLGGLCAGMAHEINNPLAGILQTAENMTRRLSHTNLPGNIRAANEVGLTMDAVSAFMEKRGIFHMLDTIRDCSARIASIVENMLVFSRPNRSAFSPQPITVLMDRAVDMASADFDISEQYDFKSIQIVKEYDPNLPLVPCERASVQMVLMNILRNSVQALYEPHPPSETKAAKSKIPHIILRASHEPESKSVRVEIEDNGPGMERDICKRAFDPFFSTKSVGCGTGIGLTFCYFVITHHHRGAMKIESAPEKGTAVSIHLPLSGDSPPRQQIVGGWSA